MKNEKSFENAILDFELGFADFLPKRLEFLAEGFSKGWDCAQMNQKLLENGCETLYARSFFEASLIYAFDHHVQYGQWKLLFDECRKLYEKRSVDGDFLSGGKVTLWQLEAYLAKESEDGGRLQTAHYTRLLESGLREAVSDSDFIAFMENNLEHLSSVREKARFYFCKYLYLYIKEKCENYYKSCLISEQLLERYGGHLPEGIRKTQELFALEELTFLKPLTRLKKEAEKASPGMTPEEKKEYLENAALTPGGIFDEFNYFYFGYISTDWVEILFELYGDFESWPRQTKLKVARSLGLCHFGSGSQEEQLALGKLRLMADDERKREEALDSVHARDEESRKKAFSRGRSGEDYFRDFIVGRRDINRSTLISFLLFVKSCVSLDEDNCITRPRLNQILQDCGFWQLRPDQSFDRFVMDFLRSRNPMDIIETEVERQVTRGNDFYLYKVYRDAYCHQKELLKYLV